MTSIQYFFFQASFIRCISSNPFYHDNDESVEYEVESFVDCVKGWYLIKWKRYPDFENLWILLEDLMNYGNKLNEY